MVGTETFADWFRRQMGTRSQRQIAQSARISQTAVGNYLVGRLPNLRDIGLIARLATAIGVSEEELQRGVGGIHKSGVQKIAPPLRFTSKFMKNRRFKAA